MKTDPTPVVGLMMAWLAAMLCACSTTIEKMDKGTDTGDHYLFVNSQWGSRMTVKTSMGTALAVDSVEAFIATAQAAVAKFGFDAATKQLLYTEITKRYEAGQITQQLKLKLEAAVAQSTSADQLTEALARIAKGG